MWLELMLGGVVAMSSVQDRMDRDRAGDEWAPWIDIEIPAIDVQLPGMDFEVPPMWIDFPVMDLSIPPMRIEVPAIELEGLPPAWQGFDFRVPAIDIQIPNIDLRLPEIDLAIPRMQVRARSGHEHAHGAHRWYVPLEAGDLIGIGAQDTDTVIEVDPNARLEVKSHAGSITVEAWDRNAVRIRARHSRRDGVRLYRAQGLVQVQSESRGFGPPSMVDYTFSVPASMALRLEGPFTDVSVTGATNGVSVETVQGYITIRNSGGVITLHSIEGLIEVVGSDGRIEATTVDEDIRITDTAGQIYAETIDGEIHLDRIRSRDVEARTVDGDVFYQGSIEDDGRYRFTTHDGDVVVSVPEGANVTVSVATFDGELIPDFPIEVSEVETRRRFSFTLGNGRARLELQSFDGDIRLQRPQP